MRKTIYILLMLLAGCAGHKAAEEQMDRAETLMQDYPDSAFRLLQRVDSAALSTKGMRARHALLYSIALDKNYIDLTTDSLIRPAVDYYDRHGDSRHRMLAYYYLARIQFTANETAKCLISLANAEKYAQETGDDFYLGMIYRLMADAYNTIYCYTEEIKYRQLSYEHFGQTDFQRHANFALLDMGLAYSNGHRYDDALSIYNKVWDIATREADSTLMKNCLSDFGHTYSLNGSYRESIRHLLQLETLFPQQVESKHYRNLANDYAALNLPDSALYYMRRAEALVRSNIDTQVTYRINYELSKYKGDYQTALQNYEKLYDLNAVVTDSIMGKSVLVTLQDHLRQQAEYESYKSRQTQRFLYLVIALLAVCAAAAAVILRQRWLSKNQEIERNIQLAQSLGDTLRTKEAHLSAMSEHIQALFSQQFESIDSLCNVYYDNQGTKFEKDRIYKEVKKQIESLGADKAEPLEAIIDTYQDGLMQRFKADFPTLSKDYQLFATYQFAGFSARAISLFTGDKVENVYNKKSRLKSRVANSASPHKEEYLRHLT